MEEVLIRSLVIVSEEAIFSKLWKLAVMDSPSPKKIFISITFHGTTQEIAPSIKDPQKLYERLFMADSYQSHLT